MKALSICLLLWVFLSGFAVDYDNDSIERLIQSKSVEELPAWLNKYAIQCLQNRELQQARHWAGQAKLAAEKVNDTIALYNAYLNMSDIDMELSRLSPAIEEASDALSLARSIKNARLKARAYNQLGILYLRIPEFEKSLFSYLQALRLIEDSINDLSDEKCMYYKALVFNNIGTVYSKMSQLEKGLEYRLKALSIRKQLADTAGIASCLQNIGVIYEKKMILDSAYIYYERALSFRKKLGKRRDIAELLMNIGVIKMKTGHYSESEQLFLQAISIFEEFQDAKFLSDAYFSLATLYLESNKLNKALSTINKCLLYARQSSTKIDEKNAYSLLSDYYARKGLYKKAWENQKRFLVLNDSIFNIQMADKIASVQNKYEIDKREKEIMLLRKDNEIKALKVKQKTIINMVLIILLILIFLLLINALFILNRRKLKQRQVEIELEKSKLLQSKLREKTCIKTGNLSRMR